MIIIEFINSPDRNILGEYKYFLDSITLGRDQGTLLINDSEIDICHVELAVKEKGLFIKNLSDSFILCNGKRNLTKQNLKSNDIVQIGQTSFKIINFLFDPSEKESEILKRNLKIILNEDSPLNEVLDYLEEV